MLESLTLKTTNTFDQTSESTSPTTTSTAHGSISKKYRISLVDVTPNNIGQMKCLNQILFPVSYTDSFYKEALEFEDWSKLAFFNDVCVGTLSCRLDSEISGKPKKLYIRTLGVLASYRRLGIGKMLLQYALKQTEKYSTLQEVYLHVQSNNEEAIRFYENNGFTLEQKIPGYYKRVMPDEAYLFSRKLKLRSASITSVGGG